MQTLLRETSLHPPLTKPASKLQTLVRLILGHGLRMIVAFVFLIPYIWLIITSLKPLNQVFTTPLTWVPQPIMWENYVTALTHPQFPYFHLIYNTLYYTLLSTGGVTISSAVVAYGFARLQFTGRNWLFGITLATLMMPEIVTLIPRYVMFRYYGLVGSYLPLILFYSFGGAYNIFLLRQFMLTIPWDLTDAAHVDGANEFTILWRIMLPLVKPALMVVAVFHFLFAWNDFLGPIIYLDEASKYPLVLGLYAFQSRFGVQWHLMMAAALATTFPLLLLFFFAQRYFIEGITVTGIKG